MAKDLYKAIGEKHGINKSERKDVKQGAVAVLQGAQLTVEQRQELRLDTHPEWRSLLGWQKKLLTEALTGWLETKKCDAILQKIGSMEDDDRHKFLAEAIRTKIKNPTRPRNNPGSSPEGEELDIKPSIETIQSDTDTRTRQISISQIINPP